MLDGLMSSSFSQQADFLNSEGLTRMYHLGFFMEERESL
jgi:hypothetical protein